MPQKNNWYTGCLSYKFSNADWHVHGWESVQTSRNAIAPSRLREKQTMLHALVQLVGVLGSAVDAPMYQAFISPNGGGKQK